MTVEADQVGFEILLGAGIQNIRTVNIDNQRPGKVAVFIDQLIALRVGVADKGIIARVNAGKVGQKTAFRDEERPGCLRVGIVGHQGM